MDDTSARALIAAILKQAYDDYTKCDDCPEWCKFKDSCSDAKKSKEGCEVRDFVHSAWCAALTEGLNIDHGEYVQACMKNHRLSKNTYRYVEGEIRHYKATKRELERLKDDIINASPVANEVRGSGIDDSTANKAIKISLNNKLAGMERRVKAIEKVYAGLSKDKQVAIENIWTRKYTNIGLADIIGVNERTIKRWKQNIVYSVAIELKYL